MSRNRITSVSRIREYLVMQMVKKIISGGQTGADRGALDAAMANNIEHGGSIPKGRLTEDGPLPLSYKLEELDSFSYPVRTEKNVVASEGTVIVSHGPLTQGSLLTQRFAEKHEKPCLHLDLNLLTLEEGVNKLTQFLQTNGIEILNVAGPRASGDLKIYGATYQLVERTLVNLSG